MRREASRGRKSKATQLYTPLPPHLLTSSPPYLLLSLPPQLITSLSPYKGRTKYFAARLAARLLPKRFVHNFHIAITKTHKKKRIKFALLLSVILPLHLITPSRASGTADYVESLNDLFPLFLNPLFLVVLPKQCSSPFHLLTSSPLHPR